MSFLRKRLLTSLEMLPEPETSAENVAGPKLGSVVDGAIARRYGESGAEAFGIARERFQSILAAVVVRYGASFTDAEKVELVESLRVEELVLARACSAGVEAAWDTFLARYRAALHATALRLTHDEASARELAGELTADLYGVPNRDGRRVSKLDYYMGRGSLEGWLRTVLAREHIDRCRSYKNDVSLEEQIERGVPFAQPDEPMATDRDDRVGPAIAETLAELKAEERFLLASYYLDQRTLAEIGKQMGVHESTISRKLDRLTGALRKRVRWRLQTAGVAARQCDELLQDLDVRAINVDVAGNLKQGNLKQAGDSKQESSAGSF
jgi:RNA polymerase sigma-70 factor (ECF subfamily)